VELMIFAKYYKCEIFVFDITRKRFECFGERDGYFQRIYLLYDGVHYDCLVWNLVSATASLDFDVTVFSPADKAVFNAASLLVEKEHQSGRFVDEYNYQLKCNDCGKILVGNKEATTHAKSTGHTNFVQNG